MSDEASLALHKEITSLNPSPIVELFELHLRPVGDDTILYFHNGAVMGQNKVSFRGIPYDALPIGMKGFEFSGSGEPARPTLSLMNFGGFVSAVILNTNDLVGAVVVRRRTLVKYLDGGSNASAYQPEFPPDVYVIEQKMRENRQFVEFELGSGFDLDGVRFPNRHVIGSYCTHSYRGSGCSFGGRICVTNNRNQRYVGAENYRGVWNKDLLYENGDSVEYEMNGYWRVFQCEYGPGTVNGANTPENNPAIWKEKQRWVGAWKDIEYLANDVVSRQVKVWGSNLATPKDMIMIVAKAKTALPAGTPPPPNSLFWDTDSCTKSTLACSYRFDGKQTKQVLPFGGFPGTLQMPSDV